MSVVKGIKKPAAASYPHGYSNQASFLKELAVFFVFFLEKCLLFSKKSLTLQGKNNFCERKNFFKTLLNNN